jgi:hypothetical protein
MAAAHLGLLTSVREGFANVLLEMMGAGVRHIVTTPCAGDLDTLNGVDVVEDHAAEAIGAALAQAASAGLDHSALYGPVLARRSPERFVGLMLGTVDGGMETGCDD